LYISFGKTNAHGGLYENIGRRDLFKNVKKSEKMMAVS